MIPVEDRGPVEALNGRQLFQELLDDACANYATPLYRFSPAIKRISKLWKKHPEDVFKELVAAKREKTGNGHMPGTLL